MVSLIANLLSLVILQSDYTLIILIDKFFMDLIPLLFQELSGPYHLLQDIIYSENIGLSWTISVQFLFYGLNIGPYFYHVHEDTSVNTHILVYIKWCINVPIYIARFVYLQDQC